MRDRETNSPSLHHKNTQTETAIYEETEKKKDRETEIKGSIEQNGSGQNVKDIMVRTKWYG